MIRFLTIVTIPVALWLCACTAEPAPNETAMTACEAALDKAAEILPTDLVSDVTDMEAGQSGTAVSCAVRSDKAHLMIDARITCAGPEVDFAKCTAIEAVQTMDGVSLYP
ncbi:MAG: hypothetical protein RIB03_11595 [Henriciella sp.]|uniref:hypothetical protein n=1 Tax=Henriciella sp. TaxID=1968823 RepID=UPI0032F0786C